MSNYNGMSVLLLNYNNYRNRIIKKENSITAYIEAVTEYGIFTNQNFPPKDGLSTSIVLNKESNYTGSFDDINTGNYIVVFDPLTYIIVSRWFILDMDQIRNGQYRVALKRDVVVDYYDSIIEADSYIEKAYINSSDVAIYNSEDISFNQIKKSETLLKDRTNSAWIVGYYTEIDADKPISISDRSINQDITVSNITTWEFYSSTNLSTSTPYKKVNALAVKVKVEKEELQTGYSYYNVNTNGDITEGTESNIPHFSLAGYDINTFRNWFANNRLTFENIFYNRTSYGNSDIQNLNNKIIYDSSSSKYYSIQVNKGLNGAANVWEGISTAFSIDVTRECEDSGMFNVNITTLPSTGYNVSYTNYTLVLTELSENTLSFTFKKDVNKLQDAPYKMFAIPYNKCTVVDNNSSPTRIFDTDSSMALTIASEIAKNLGSFLYDIQLLPYCPFKDIIFGDYLTLTTLVDEGQDYTIIKDNAQNPRSLIVFPKFSNFSFDIEYSITLPTDPIELKTINDCDLYRLCSPNYAAVFELNPVKTGNITKFNVDCTYKPYAPYIKLNPDWKALYGDDYNDTRGLILGGDFSIPVLNDKWIEYQINNKNYLNAFNRNIESVELRNKFALIGDIASATAGTIGAAAQGGWVGGVASGVAGAADVAINQYLRKDAVDLTKDQFNYSLENIKALPNTLAKVSSFDFNNKLFPVLEYYSCTDQEKEAYRNKLIFNGMKVMRIDKIKNFITNERHYIKAKIIRINVCCNHLANEIANELNMGVYL